MRSGGNFGPPYVPAEDQRIEAYGDGERKPDWSNFATVFNASARAAGRPERKPYGLEQRYRALKRKKGVAGKPAVKTAGAARRRGRPPGKKKEQSKQPPPVKGRRGRVLTEKEEAEVAKLAAECFREQVDVQEVRAKFEARHPNRKGLPTSIYYNALRRTGVYAARKRGDPPELAIAELPEDLVERARVELDLIKRRAQLASEATERHRQEYNRLLRTEEVIRDFLFRMEKVAGFDESKPHLDFKDLGPAAAGEPVSETAPAAPSAHRGPHEWVHDDQR